MIYSTLIKTSTPSITHACGLALLTAAVVSMSAGPLLAHADEPQDHADPANQKHTLTAPSSPRFEITDRVWPTKVGEADICLWKDDKLAALSFTIDDNNRPDHDWWIEQGKANGWKFTWFVITGLVDKSPAYYGTWDDFAHLLELGHDVQSHSVTHLDPKRGYTDIQSEYEPSIKMIEENLPGHKVVVLAYPGGANMADNDHELAAKLFIAARGVQGLINPANTIDYNNTNSVSTIPFESNNWADVRNLLDPDGYNNGLNYRGWYSCHYHSLNDKRKENLLKVMAYLKEHDDDIWVGLFREVALYGQERDTAKLDVTQIDDNTFTLSLSDQMDDDLFQYPLDVKLRVPESWAAAKVTQGDHVTTIPTIQHNTSPYVIVPVIPDAGVATVMQTDADPMPATLTVEYSDQP